MCIPMALHKYKHTLTLRHTHTHTHRVIHTQSYTHTPMYSNFLKLTSVTVHFIINVSGYIVIVSAVVVDLSILITLFP